MVDTECAHFFVQLTSLILNDKLRVMLIQDCQGLIQIPKTTFHSKSVYYFDKIHTPVKKKFIMHAPWGLLLYAFSG
jgi:hypothetical protein